MHDLEINIQQLYCEIFQFFITTGFIETAGIQS